MGRRITCGRGARYRSVERRVTVLSLGTFQKLLHLEPAFDLGPYTFDYLYISPVFLHSNQRSILHLNLFPVSRVYAIQIYRTVWSKKERERVSPKISFLV